LHSENDIYSVAEYLAGAKRFTIQEFKPRNTLDPAFEQVRPFSTEEITTIRTTVAAIISSSRPSKDKESEGIAQEGSGGTLGPA
jgi:hypothetical protein